MNYLRRRRTITLFWVFGLIYAGLIGHLAYIQVYSGSTLSKQAIAQQTQTVSLEVPSRGEILDRKFRPLTSHLTVWRVVIFPIAVANRYMESRTLAATLEVSNEEIARYFTGGPHMLPYNLNDDQAEQVRKLGLQGISVVEAQIQSRKPAVASHLLGYLGKTENNRWQGEMGIEAFYDRELQSTVPGKMARIFLDARGQYVPGLGIQVIHNVQDNSRKNVVLTIDRDFQEIAENVMDKSGVKDGAVVVMDVRSGDIVAMARRPDYMFGGKENESDAGPAEQSFLNHGLSIYQPGSVFKVIVAAAALEEGIVKPDSLFLCIGEKDELVRCYKKDGHGIITFAEAVAYSCNPTFARVGLKVGAEKLIMYAKKFGLANSSLIGYKKKDLSTELQMIAEPNSLVNASLGQWPVRATVVQITAMMAAVANDGVYIQPRLVSEIRTKDGTIVKTIEPGQETRAVSKSSAEVMQILLEMVTKVGTGTLAHVPNGGSAGKTGSAQVGDEKVDAWFSGYAPVNNPRYVATVLVNDGESGGKTAAPLFKKIMQEILDKDI